MLAYLLPALAYLLGSVSTGVLVARALGLADPRATGSKNPGATNLLRYGGKLAAVLTLAGDLLKGVLAILAAGALTDDTVILALTGLAVFLGHLWPLFFGFHGGKGVATALGVWLALNPWVGLALAGGWLTLAFVFRYSSLAAIVSALLTPLYVWWFMPVAPFLYASLIMTALLIWRHRSNLKRLASGKESKIRL
jgi:glycerol-3-phosphate acyltransferase PlsY